MPVSYDGRWVCGLCHESESGSVSNGGGRQLFESKEELINDHLQFIFDGLEYLSSSTVVDVLIHTPNEIEELTSKVQLQRLDRSHRNYHRYFQIPIGKIKVSNPRRAILNDPSVQWVFRTLTEKIADMKQRSAVTYTQGELQ